jgi:hypothetical protein
LRKTVPDIVGDRFRFECVRKSRGDPRPDPGFKAFHGQFLRFEHLMMHVEAAAAKARNRGFHGDVIAEAARDQELGPRLDHGDHDAAVLHKVRLGEARRLE